MAKLALHHLLAPLIFLSIFIPSRGWVFFEIKKRWKAIFFVEEEKIGF